jgi:DNA polymerase-3 subunit epsilon
VPVGGAPPAPGAPRRADRALSWRRTAFASLDFETTGLDYARDAIVSFGVVPVQGGRVRLAEAVHQLVSPSVPASPTSMRVHHLLPKDLEGAPDVAGASERLRAALEGRFLLAWFAELEVAFLARTFGTSRRSWWRRTVDVRRLAIAVERLEPDSRRSLTAAAERAGVPVDSPHDALDDALVAAQLFLVLAGRLERVGAGRVRDLIALTRGGLRAVRLERRVRAAV